MVNCRRTGLSTPTRLIDKMHLKISAVFYPVECYAFLISQPEKQLIKASLWMNFKLSSLSDMGQRLCVHVANKVDLGF